MATKITAMVAASAASATDLVPVIQSSAGPRKMLMSQIGTFVRALFTTTPATIAEGGTGAATAATARTNLGATTIGSSIFTAANAAAERALITPLTTKGDLWSFDTVDNRLAIGSNGQGLIVDSIQTLGMKWGVPVLRSYLSGLTLSTAGSSATMSIAAGQAADSTNVYMMNLASAISKTTGSWAVGTGNGGKLTAGAVANNTWYHFYEIYRSDTGVVDVGFDISATVATLPTNYTHYRRIGAGLTNGSAQWTAFIQDGDYFRWLASVLDVNASNPGISAVTTTLASVPTGINVFALFNFALQGTSGGYSAYISDLAATDEAVSTTAAPLSSDSMYASAGTNSMQMIIRTNTSAQIRYRLLTSDASTTVKIATIGWIDARGRNL